MEKSKPLKARKQNQDKGNQEIRHYLIIEYIIYLFLNRLPRLSERFGFEW
jgi:hypothetical protein